MSRSRPFFVLISFISLAAVAGASDVTSVAGGYTLGTGRTVPTIAALLGLIGVIAGVVTLVRPALRWGAKMSLILSIVSAAVGGLHAVYAAGGVGTGNGLAGAVLAVALGVIGMSLAALAFSRARRTA